MRLSRQTIDRLVALYTGSRRHGELKEFCQREGVSRQALYHWLNKLGLSPRTYRKHKCKNPEMHPTSA